MLILRSWLNIKLKKNDTEMIIKTTRFLLPCKTDEPMILKEQLLKAIKVIRMFPIFILSVPFVLFLLYLKASISYESTIRTILGYMAIGFSFVAIPFIVLCFIFISIYRSLLNYIQKNGESLFTRSKMRMILYFLSVI